jgi:peptidoglycan/LPS O-acetylase OafA/YrhL
MQRIKELDSIRGLASLAIVVYYLWLSNIGLMGAAVNLFFVLSGFLITSILLTHVMSHRFLLAFYARRALRIWPVYYLSVMILVLLNPFIPRLGRLDGLPYFATFTQIITYYWSDSAPAFIPAFRLTWRVAIEEQFYMFWPALFWLIGRRGITLATMCLIAIAVTTRILQFNSWILITHCDGLGLGALLASWSVPTAADKPWQEPRYLSLGLASVRLWLGGAIALRLAPPTWLAGWLNPVQSLRLLSLNLAFFAIVGLTTQYSGYSWLSIIRHPWLVYLGKISYGLYLYYHIVFMLWDDYAAKGGIENHLGIDLAKTAISVAIAALSWRFVEQPILSLKDWFGYQRDAEAEGSNGLSKGLA